MTKLKKWLVDVPVKVSIWIRPDFQREQFEIIRQARPSVLFLCSDGGRNDLEWEKININRRMYDNEIDWDCLVYKLYNEKNIGLYSMIKKSDELIWSNVDRCIILEDDDIPSISFFEFCRQMLDKYESDYRIQGISGFNPFEISTEVNSDYFFSGEYSCWGSAIWKRSYELIYDYEMDFFKDDYVVNIMKSNLEKSTFKGAYKCAVDGEVYGHPPGPEFFFGIAKATQNALFVMPKYNLITNIGARNDSEHATSFITMSKAEQKLHNSKRFEINFPLKHPKYVIRDRNFELRYRSLNGAGNNWKIWFRRIIKSIKIIKYEGYMRFISLVRNRLTRKVEK